MCFIRREIALTVEDRKKVDGKWQRTVRFGEKVVHTRAGLLWENMQSRVRRGGAHQRNFPAYVGVTCEFADFQDFAEWCQTQVGYSGGFELDKDLLLKGNTVYSKSTVVFLPTAINKCLPNCKAVRGKYPVGVTLCKRDGRFLMKCRLANGQRVQEYHSSVDDAFTSYKRTKEDVLKHLAESWKAKIDVRAYQALVDYNVEITD